MYEKFANWKNLPDESTPITAAALAHIEQGITDVDITRDGTPAEVALSSRLSATAGSAEGLVQAERAAREAAVTAEATARVAAIEAETAARKTAIIGESDARIAGLALKANAADVYTKNAVYTKGEVESGLSQKPNKADVYTKAETYSRAETGTQITNSIAASRPPLYGTGFPNGVVAAPAGTLYSDTAVTNGASLWQKVSGTGNTGWEVARGDTGERDVRALLAAPFRVSAGPAFHASLSRENGFVQLGLRVEVIAPVAAGRTTVLTLPTGFTIPRYGVKGTGAVMRGGRETPVVLTSLGAPDGIDLMGEALSVGDILSAQIVGRTRTAWPTTLPGTN